MDWQAITAGVVGLGLGTPLAIYGTWRFLQRQRSADGAERFANDWHQTVIARQDKEAERLRIEIQTLRDQRRQDQDLARERMENLRREYTEFRARAEVEFKVQRKVSQATAMDIRKINDGKIPEERLETVMLVTGMGPLDR